MDKIIILDFGSQYTQLIARRIRELSVNAQILPYNKAIDLSDKSIKGIVLSGSPCSVRGENVLHIDLDKLLGQRPVLGVCYGAQYIAQFTGGRVEQSDKREYGPANLTFESNSKDPILKGIANKQVWMSHADSIMELSSDFEVLITTA
jgi:GMP synthase (glutamine-hydrolysing)